MESSTDQATRINRAIAARLAFLSDGARESLRAGRPDAEARKALRDLGLIFGRTIPYESLLGRARSLVRER